MLDQENIKLGIAPIAWTNDDLPELGGHISLERCLDEMAQAQFIGCELGNKFPREPEALKAQLNPRGLQLASGWFSTFFTENREEQTVEDFIKHRDFLCEMGSKVIVVCECGHSVQGKAQSVFETKPVFNEKQWEQLAAGLEKLGKIAHEKNMKIVFHHHMGTGVQTRNEIDTLMEITDPEWVSLLLDTGHITYSGDSPQELVKTYLSRIHHVHLKDIRKSVLEEVKLKKMSFLDSVKAGVFTVPGDGMINFLPVFQTLADSEYKGWFIVEAEQDPDKSNPLEYAEKARHFIRQTTSL